MTEWIWINGEVMPLSDARVSVEDRGLQFADSVYEVIRIYNGKPYTLNEHLERLWQSAVGVQMTPPFTTTVLFNEVVKLIGKSAVREGMVYMQLTRGVAPRNHVFPTETKPSLLFYIRQLPPVKKPGEGEGVKLLAVPDERWKRCWIKSTALLPNVLAKNAAIAAGADEAAFVDAGYIAECSTSNLFAVINGKLVTPPVGTKVLPGITRKVLLGCAEELAIEVDERLILEAEAPRADELFITSTTREVSWVSRWNDIYIGQGKCGEITKKLHAQLQKKVKLETM